MSDTLGYCVPLVAPGVGGGSDLTATLRPLSSALGTLMVSDFNHLASENPLRTLFTHKGFVGTKSLYARSAWILFSGAPPPESINWGAPIDASGDYTGRANLRMGSHAIHRDASGRLPWVQLKCRAKAPATFTVGIVLALARGRNKVPVDAGGSGPTGSGYGFGWDAIAITNTSYADITLTLALRDEDLERETVEVATGTTASGPEPVVETVGRNMLTLWMGAYCTSNSAGSVGSIAGVTCCLIPPG